MYIVYYKLIITLILGEVSRILIKYYACLETLPCVGVHDYIYDAITNKAWQVGA